MFTKLRSSFTVQLWSCVAVLTAVCALLALLTWTQGPRVRAATLDTTLVTTANNQQLLLHLNQPFGALTKQQVRITPAASFSVTSSGNTLAVQFSQPLRNNTPYKLTFETADKRYTMQHTFRTAAATYYYAVETARATEIHRKTIGNTTSEVVYSQEKVDDYLVIGDSLILSVREADNSNSLQIYHMPTRQITHIQLPAKGTVSQLRSATYQRAFGFVFTDYASGMSGIILLYDMNTQKLRGVALSQNQPLEVRNWLLAHNGTSVLAQTLDSSTLLLTHGAPPIPLGEYTELFGFSHDDGSILMRLLSGAVQLDVTDHTQQPLIESDPDTYVTDAIPFAARSGSILQLQVSEAGVSTQKILIQRPNAYRQLHAIDAYTGYIDAISLAANDQYVGSEERLASTDAQHIRIIDSNSGKVISTAAGAKVRWPSGL